MSEADFSDDRASEELRRGLPTPSFLLVSTSESQFSRKSGANAEVVELGPGYCIIFWFLDNHLINLSFLNIGAVSKSRLALS